MLCIKHLSKWYGKCKAIDDLSFNIEDGMICGFIGHNGAGKTTTLKAIVGVLDFDEGDVVIDGHSLKKKPIDCKKAMAYVGDQPDVYNYLTGLQYLKFIFDMYRIPKDQRKDVYRYTDMLALTSYLKQPISSYSHGMKQKLVLCAAFAHAPRLIVMDEPFVGLDPKAMFVFKNIMREFCDKGGSILFSTHVLDVAEKVCDQIVVIHEGRIVKNGYVKDLVVEHSLEDEFLALEKNNA